MAKYIDLNGLTEFWRKAKEYIDSHSGGGDGNVFIAQYGDTEFNEIKAAFDAGKAIFCVGDIYVEETGAMSYEYSYIIPGQYVLDTISGMESFLFVGFAGKSLKKYSITDDGSWTGGYLDTIISNQSISLRTFDPEDDNHNCGLYLSQPKNSPDVSASISSVYHTEYANGGARMAIGSFTASNPDVISIKHDSTTSGTDDNIVHHGSLNFGVNEMSDVASAGYCDIDISVQDEYMSNEAISYVHMRSNPFDSSGNFVEIGVRPDNNSGSERRYVFNNEGFFAEDVYNNVVTYGAFLSSNCPNPESVHIWVGTQAQYNALTPDSNTVYIIK